jgi:transmembrane sensor
MSYKRFSMDLTDMPIKLILHKLIQQTDFTEDEKFRNRVEGEKNNLQEFRTFEKIWKESSKLSLFGKIDTRADWEKVQARILIHAGTASREVPLYKHLLRIAAIVVLVSAVAAGIFKTSTFFSKLKSPDFTAFTAANGSRNILLPDGSSVTLKAGSSLTYGSDFGKKNRPVVLNGEALFEVASDKLHPFLVYSGASVVEVTGTRFNVREEKGSVQVSVLSGNVLFSNSTDRSEKIRIAANQSGVYDGKKLTLENRIEPNTLSWKTGHLVFHDTPIDTALIDIARHFRRDLVIEAAITDDITAEFQNQPLNEILEEINLVAGLKFDTTGTALIVRK